MRQRRVPDPGGPATTTSSGSGTATPRSRRRRPPSARSGGRRRSCSPASRTRCRPRGQAAVRSRHDPSHAVGNERARIADAFAASVTSPSRRSTIRPAQYASSSANRPWNPAHTIDAVVCTARATADRFRSEPRKTVSHAAAAARTARVPFVSSRSALSPARRPGARRRCRIPRSGRRSARHPAAPPPASRAAPARRRSPGSNTPARSHSRGPARSSTSPASHRPQRRPASRISSGVNATWTLTAALRYSRPRLRPPNRCTATAIPTGRRSSPAGVRPADL